MQQVQQRIILLPSKHVPESVKGMITDVKEGDVRFINGYRNILLQNQTQFQWALAQNEQYCGQAFCYLLKPQVKRQQLLDKKIKQVSEQMYVLQVIQQIKQPQAEISLEKLRQLVNSVTNEPSVDSNKLSLNLVKNAFSSFETYQKVIGQNLQTLQKELLKEEGEPHIPTVTEVLALENNAKKLQGEEAKRLPKCNQQTGYWDEGQTVVIKLE